MHVVVLRFQVYHMKYPVLIVVGVAEGVDNFVDLMGLRYVRLKVLAPPPPSRSVFAPLRVPRGTQGCLITCTGTKCRVLTTP